MRTVNGLAARIYAGDAGGEFPVHGAVYAGGEWRIMKWKRDGRAFSDGQSELDLTGDLL